jgi:hypothetical protein
MDGFTLLSRVMEFYPEIPVIIITGYSTPEMERLAREGGAVGYIEKPFMVEALARKIVTTLRRESEGGTLHSVSSGMFLQLIEMEQKTCTIRLHDKSSGKQGVLFFQDGALLDARVNGLQGEAAAYEIFCWDEVTLTIQHGCPQKEKKIESELQGILLEAMRLKDEATDDESLSRVVSDEDKDEEIPEDGKLREQGRLGRMKSRLEKSMGERQGIESMDYDDSWDGFIAQAQRIGKFFNAGELKLGYIDKSESNDLIIVPGNETILITVNPKCPRDRTMEVIIE